MPISNNDTTDDLDQQKVVIADTDTGDAADVELKEGGKYGVHVIAEIDGDDDLPKSRLYHFTVDLIDGGTTEMAVNGSVTPVEYKATVPAGQIWYLSKLNIIISDNGTSDPTDFGSLSSLTNGLLVENKLNGTRYQKTNMKTNINIVKAFGDAQFAGKGSGFLNDANLYEGLWFHKPFEKMIGDDGDELIVTVRDDLTSLTFLSMTAEFVRVI